MLLWCVKKIWAISSDTRVVPITLYPAIHVLYQLHYIQRYTCCTNYIISSDTRVVPITLYPAIHVLYQLHYIQRYTCCTNYIISSDTRVVPITLYPAIHVLYQLHYISLHPVSAISVDPSARGRLLRQRADSFLKMSDRRSDIFT